jgi:hypothetical protein
MKGGKAAQAIKIRIGLGVSVGLVPAGFNSPPD